MPYAHVDHDGEIEIYYEDQGSGEPLVLIGGFTSTVEVWAPQVPALTAHYRVIRPDNRGSGRTRLIRDDGERTIARFAGDVRALLDSLGLDTVHLLGASMGGMIVQEFAARYPARLRSLVVACSHAGGSMAVPADPAVMAEFAVGSAGEATEAQRRRTLEIVFHPRSLEAQPEVVEAYEAAKQEFPHPAAELEARIAGVVGFDVRERLPGIGVPTLVMCGEGDQIVPPENSRRIADAIPDAELVTFPNSGHLFFAQAADDVNAAFLSFLASHSLVAR